MRAALPSRGPLAALPHLLLIALIHLLLAWPGAGSRGVIAEEVQSYLHHYPKVLDTHADRVALLPPNDDPALLAAVEDGRAVKPRFVGTSQWPELGYHGERRVWPVFVRGHQTAIGAYPGVALGPLLGGGIGGARRANVLVGLALLGFVWGLGRRIGLSRGFATLAAIACAISPGLWFFSRTGYGFELASRALMMVCLWVAAPREPLTRARAWLIGGTFAVAVLCRMTIPATLAPALLLMLLDPRRFAGRRRVAEALAVGVGAPIALLAAAIAALPFAPGTTPAAALPLGDLAGRTGVAPAFAAMQLAWVADARFVLGRIVEGDLRPSFPVVPAMIAGAVAALALHRWWHARAGEAERLFVGALLGNALVGAWLYGDPLQFQLGMALEPLFALAVAQQLASLAETRARAAIAVAMAALGLRAFTLGQLAASERRTDNGMLSGRAQREVVAALARDGIRGDELITTTYDHVGVLEIWTGEALRPIHAWRRLMAKGVAEERVVDQWSRLLETIQPCRVLLTRARNPVAGPFTDDRLVAAALDRALAQRGAAAKERLVIRGDGGGPVFELVSVAPCKRAGGGGG